MQLHFSKYQGTGNDFILIDDRKRLFPDDNVGIIEKLCDRKFGIGADGLILIRDHEILDFEMVFFNADGSQSMCGNGSRCAVQFARHLGIIAEKTYFLSTDGEHHAFIEGEIVHLDIRPVEGVHRKGEDFFINTGSPHHVKMVEDVTAYDVFKEGKAIRERYNPEGTNVNFVEVLGDKEIFVRTFERGVEDETLSCGTGVTACSIAMSYKSMANPIKVKTLGGELSVSFEKTGEQSFDNIYLIGPAEKVFEGQVEI